MVESANLAEHQDIGCQAVSEMTGECRSRGTAINKNRPSMACSVEVYQARLNTLK